MAQPGSLAGLGDTDVLERLAETRDELFNLRFQFATSQLDDSSALKKAKKNVARMLTEVRAREIAAAAKLERAASRMDRDD